MKEPGKNTRREVTDLYSRIRAVNYTGWKVNNMGNVWKCDSGFGFGLSTLSVSNQNQVCPFLSQVSNSKIWLELSTFEARKCLFRHEEWVTINKPTLKVKRKHTRTCLCQENNNKQQWSTNHTLQLHQLPQIPILTDNPECVSNSESWKCVCFEYDFERMEADYITNLEDFPKSPWKLLNN